MISYLSPTSLGLWLKDKDQFYVKYGFKTLKEPQTKQMAIGAIFDAYIKGYLNEKFYGVNTSEAILQKQLEPQNRAFVEKGICVYEQYVAYGCAADLMTELHKPQFEGNVITEIGGVPVSGKPDLYDDNLVVDWKVNGYFGSASPAKGYVLLRPDNKQHKDACIQDGVNISYSLADVDESWNRQLGIYGLAIGLKVPFRIGIDQLVFRDGHMRVAKHRYIFNQGHSDRLIKELQEAWGYISRDHYFPDLTPEASKRKQDTLRAAFSLEDKNDAFFVRTCRPSSTF